MTNNKYNAGFAPIVIIWIIVAAVAVGSGTYYVATKNSAKVTVETATPSTSVSASSQPSATVKPATATPKPSVSKSPTLSATPKPTATKTPEAVTFATVQAAVNSGKHVICVSVWWGEKGPDEYRNRYDISGSTVIAYEDTKSDGQITTTTTTYTPSSADYSSVLTYGLSNTTCTQR